MIERHITPAITSLLGKYPVLTVTGPEELMEEMKALRGQLKLSFDHTEGGR